MVSATVLIGGTPLQCSLAVHNLLDLSYRDYLSRFRYYVDDPGRDFVLRINLPLGISYSP